MKKLIALLLALVMVLSMTACGASPAPAATEAPKADAPAAEAPKAEAPAADPKVSLTFGSTSSAEDLITQAMQKVADICAEKSGGSLTINIYPASQLGDATAQLESLSVGGQDMFIEAQASYMQTYGIADAGAVSFGVANTQEKLAKLVESDLWAEWEKQFLDTTGIATIANNWIRQETVICCKKPLESIADFKGVKLRTVSSETTIAVYNSLGFSSTPIAFSEVFLSLQQGVVDATFGTKDNIYTNSFYVEAPYILMWGPSCTNLGVWINDAKLQSLTDNQKQILIDACNEAGEWYTNAANEQVSGMFDEMLANGASLTYLSDEDTATANNTLVELGRTYEGSKFSVGVIDRILAALE